MISQSRTGMYHCYHHQIITIATTIRHPHSHRLTSDVDVEVLGPDGSVDDDLAQVGALVLAHGVLALQGQGHAVLVAMHTVVTHAGVDGDERELVEDVHASQELHRLGHVTCQKFSSF